MEMKIWTWKTKDGETIKRGLPEGYDVPIWAYTSRGQVIVVPPNTIAHKSLEDHFQSVNGGDGVA